MFGILANIIWLQRPWFELQQSSCLSSAKTLVVLNITLPSLGWNQPLPHVVHGPSGGVAQLDDCLLWVPFDRMQAQQGLLVWRDAGRLWDEKYNSLIGPTPFIVQPTVIPKWYLQQEKRKKWLGLENKTGLKQNKVPFPMLQQVQKPLFCGLTHSTMLSTFRGHAAQMQVPYPLHCCLAMTA